MTHLNPQEFLLVFDLDGTLIDSKKDIVQSVNHALLENSFNQLPARVIENYVGRGLSHLIEDCLENPKPKIVESVIKSFWKHYDEHLLDHTQLYPEVLEVLEFLHPYPKAIVTNKPYHFTLKTLEGLSILQHFQWVIGGDSLPIQKPAPEIMQPIYETLSSKPQGLFIGDSKIDIDCGKASGLYTCGVSYGFRPRQELIDAQADFILDSFAELKTLKFFTPS